MRGVRGAARAFAGVVALLLLAACVQVPNSGRVHAGPEVSSDDEPVLRYVPSGPRRGAQPAAIINGYLDAMRAYPPNPGIVRKFLTDRAAGSWSPSAGTRIYIERPEVEELGNDAVSIEAELLASLTERGKWTTLAPSEQRLQAEFRLRLEGGQWRITNPLDGLLIPEYDFERYYRAYSLYFFDPALRVLVPDPVYLPMGDQTATLLLRGLLRGPTEWLRGAVDSFVPQSDHAEVSVPINDNGVAQVQLSTSAGGLGATERDLLAAQLVWTLRQVSDVEAIRVTVGGAPLPLEGGDDVTDVDSGTDYDPADSAASHALFALRRGRVVQVDTADGVAQDVPGLFGSGEVPVAAFAVERTAKTIAVVPESRSTVQVGAVGASEADVWLEGAANLLGAQWDIHGLLWAVDRTSAGPRLHVLREDGSAVVELRGDAPEDISAFALSRDGLRLAVIEGQGDSSRLLVGRVRRPAGGSLNLAVDNWRRVDPGPTPVRGFVDVAWASPTELTVLAEESAGSRQVFTMSIDGSVVEPSVLVDVGLLSVADAPVADLPAVLGTDDGDLLLQLSDRWTDLGLEGEVTQPAYVE